MYKDEPCTMNPLLGRCIQDRRSGDLEWVKRFAGMTVPHSHWFWVGTIFCKSFRIGNPHMSIAIFTSNHCNSFGWSTPQKSQGEAGKWYTEWTTDEISKRPCNSSGFWHKLPQIAWFTCYHRKYWDVNPLIGGFVPWFFSFFVHA